MGSSVCKNFINFHTEFQIHILRQGISFWSPKLALHSKFQDLFSQPSILTKWCQKYIRVTHIIPAGLIIMQPESCFVTKTGTEQYLATVLQVRVTTLELSQLSESKDQGL